LPQFYEVLRCAGVDEDALPPGMVVPFGGSNVVALQTWSSLNKEWASLRVASNHAGVEVEEIDPTDVLKQRTKVSIAVAQRDDDLQYREAMMPDPVGGNARWFRVHGKKALIDFPGALVEARSKRKVEASLRVVVTKNLIVKVAIRNVQVRGANGNIVFHSKTPCDPETEINMMNSIWSPQTNMAFELVPSSPALVDTSDEPTREALVKGFGLKDPDSAVLAPDVEPTKLKDLFKKLKVDGANITFFLVERLKDGSEQPDGITMHMAEGIAFIAGHHGRSTFAHEAGHFLGGHFEADGRWHGLRHTGDTPQSRDARMLMRDRGAGWKIPFPLVEQFRSFFKRHPD
jgi:hypothetical protein